MIISFANMTSTIMLKISENILDKYIYYSTSIFTLIVSITINIGMKDQKNISNIK